MFHNRRNVFLFVCSIVFVQAIYYIVTLQIKKDSNIINYSLISISALIYNQSSDKPTPSVQLSHINIANSSSVQVSQLKRRGGVFTLTYSETLSVCREYFQ